MLPGHRLGWSTPPSYDTYAPDPHADAFQMEELAPISGNMTIRGNYFDPQKDCTKTAIIFATGSASTNTTNIIFESNRVTTWGANTIWCADSDSCIVRYNVFDAVFEAQVGNRCGSPCPGSACCSYPNEAFAVGKTEDNDYECNRYESDGSFIEQQYINDDDVTHVTSACPSYTPR